MKRVLIAMAFTFGISPFAMAQVSPLIFGPAPTLNTGTLFIPPFVIIPNPPPSVSPIIVAPEPRKIPPSIIPVIRRNGKCYIDFFNELTEVDCEN